MHAPAGAAADTPVPSAAPEPRGEPRGELMVPEGYVLTSVILGAIGVAGCLCNGVVLLIYLKDRQLWTPLNLLLLNLVIGDFSVATLGTPFTFVASVMRRWVFGEAMCVVYGFFMALMGITSITTLMVLSFERYLMISRPFGVGAVGGLSKRGAVGLVAGAWLYSLGLTAPPLFGWGQYTHEAGNVSCSVNWETRDHNSASYIVFLFVFGLAVPVLVMVWSYVNIMCTIRYNANRLGQVTKAQRRIGYMVFVMVVSFMLAWSPYAGFSLWAAFVDPSDISPGWAVAPAIFAKSSVCYNPFIYVALNTQFRASWKRMWGPNSCETSLEAGAEPSVPGEMAVTCTQQTTAGYGSPETPLRRPNTPPPLYRRQRKLERLQRLQRAGGGGGGGSDGDGDESGSDAANNNVNNNNSRGVSSAPNSESANTTFVPEAGRPPRPRSAPVSTVQDPEESPGDQPHCQRAALGALGAAKNQGNRRQKDRQTQIQLKAIQQAARKQSRAERQLEKALERHRRELDHQREKQDRLEEKRRRKEDSLRRLQQQQLSAKFHPACLVALVTDPRNNTVLSVKMGDSVTRHGAPGLLARCFGKPDLADQTRPQPPPKKKVNKKSRKAATLVEPSLDGLSVSSANQGIEVFEVEIRDPVNGDLGGCQDHRVPPTESAL